MIPVKCAFDEMVPIEKLVGNPANPNTHPANQVRLLARVIAVQGWRVPITVSRQSGFIVRGHGRFAAAKLLGAAECPVDFQDYATEAEEYADLVADNRLAELAEIDKGLLAEVMTRLEDVDFDLDMTGYSEKEIKKLFEKDTTEAPEVEFAEELLLEHNYIVLYFDNALDWQVAIEKFGLKKVKDLIPRKGQPTGIGRVIRGAEWLDRIQ